MFISKCLQTGEQVKKGETLVWEEDLVCPSLWRSQVSMESFVEKRKIKKKNPG